MNTAIRSGEAEVESACVGGPGGPNEEGISGGDALRTCCGWQSATSIELNQSAPETGGGRTRIVAGGKSA